MAKRRDTSADRARKQAEKSAKLAAKDAKRIKAQAEKIYKAKIKEMRPYLRKLRDMDLRHHLDPHQKAYVTRAWEEYQGLTLRPHKVYRSKNKKKLDVARKVANRDAAIKFDVAFIPTVNDTAKVRIKGDKLIVSSKYVEEAEILFDMRALAADPEKELRRVLAENPEYDQFVLMAGKFIWNGGISRGRVIDRIIPQLMRYVPGGEGYEKRGPNSHFTNWALGLRGYKGKNQESVESYLAAYNKAVKAKKDQARKDRRKRSAKYGKKF